MKSESDMQLEFVAAQSIEGFLPSDLSALRLLNRSTEGPSVRLCAVGDIGLSGRVGASFAVPDRAEMILSEVAPLLKAVDISFGNLESPLSGDIAQSQLFSAPVAGASMLKRSGFSLIHLANNHVYDYGPEGLSATLAAIRRAGMRELGAGDTSADAMRLVRTDMHGVRVGWLGCGRTLVPQKESGPHYWEFDEEELLRVVQRYKGDVDLLVVSIHIGLMYMDYPRPEHKMMAEKLLAAGVHLILMHHAHVLQGVQVTARKSVCCYNLGNFLLDWEEGNVKVPVLVQEQNEGAIFHFVLGLDGVTQASALPVWVDERCMVHWATGERGREILTRLARISRDLESNYESAFKRQRAERHTSSIAKVIWFHLRRGNLAFVLESARKVRVEHVGMIMRWVAGLARRLAKGPVG